jgi:hypothetical protein
MAAMSSGPLVGSTAGATANLQRAICNISASSLAGEPQHPTHMHATNKQRNFHADTLCVLVTLLIRHSLDYLQRKAAMQQR